MANLSVPSRSGLSGVSSMDYIELLWHYRKQHRAAVKGLEPAIERAPSWLWLKETKRTGSYPMMGSHHMITTD